MPDLDRARVQDLLHQCAQTVLETMYFATVEGRQPPDGGPVPMRWVEVRFRGDPPGVFQIGLSHEAALSVAAGFMGEDPQCPENTEDVIRELANVVCGAVLSRLESDSSFELGSPRLVDGPMDETDSRVARCDLLLDCGAAAVCLRLGTVP